MLLFQYAICADDYSSPLPPPPLGVGSGVTGARLMHGVARRDEHLVVRLEFGEAVVNLLRHAVVVLAMASVTLRDAERAFDSRVR